MGISMPDMTIVAVKLSGGAAITDDPVNKTVTRKMTDTRYRIRTFDMTTSSLFL